MSQRTTDDRVKSVMQVTDDGVDLSVYIQAASLLVDRLESKQGTLTSDELEMIELYLSAHNAVLGGVQTEALVTTKAIGGASTSFRRPLAGKGLQATTFGRTAQQLDSTGWLKRLMDGGPGIAFLGTHANKEHGT